MLPFLCKFDVNDGHCMFTVKKPATERVFYVVDYSELDDFSNYIKGLSVQAC